MTDNRRAQQPHHVSSAIVPVSTQHLNRNHGPQVQNYDEHTRFVVPPKASHQDQRLRQPSGVQMSQPARPSESIMPSIESENSGRHFRVRERYARADTTLDLDADNAYAAKRRCVDNIRRPFRQDLGTYESGDRRRTVLIPLDGPRRGQAMHSYPVGPLYEISNPECVLASTQSFDHNCGGQRQMHLQESQENELPSRSAPHNTRPVEIQMPCVPFDGTPSRTANSTVPSSQSSSLQSPRLVRLSGVSGSRATASGGQGTSNFDGIIPESLLPFHSSNNHGMRSQFGQMSISEEGKSGLSPTNKGNRMQALSPHEEGVLRGISHRGSQHGPLKASAELEMRPPRLVRLGQQGHTQKHDLWQQQPMTSSLRPNPAFAPPRQVTLPQANSFGEGPSQRNNPDRGCISHNILSGCSLADAYLPGLGLMAYSTKLQGPLGLRHLTTMTLAYRTLHLSRPSPHRSIEEA